MESVTGTPVADAFDPLEVMLACVRWYPKVAARDRRLLAACCPKAAGSIVTLPTRIRIDSSRSPVVDPE